MIKERKGYWIVSDKVPSKTIQGVTKSCNRQDCNLSARIGETTLMGVANYYNKEGQMIIHDPNKFTADLCCLTCGKTWAVNQDGKSL